MSGGDSDERDKRDADEARAVFAVEPNKDDEVPDSAVEVEPEVITPAMNVHADLKSKGHHPPPPPRVRAAAGTEEGGRPLTVSGDPKLARDLMTRQLLTIGPEDTLQKLEEQMQSFRFRHLPVVEGNKVVGLISHSDLLHASSSFLSDAAKERDAIIHRVPAARIMRRDMTTVRPTETLADVARTMWKERAGCVLVTETDSTLLGIITQGDFVRLAHHFLSREGSG